MSKAEYAISRDVLEAMATAVGNGVDASRVEAMTDRELQDFVDEHVTVVASNS